MQGKKGILKLFKVFFGNAWVAIKNLLVLLDFKAGPVSLLTMPK
jgi:hypothetical protein